MDNFIPSKDGTNSNGAVNKYSFVYLTTPSGKKRREDLGALTNKYFNKKPIYIIEKASNHNTLFDSIKLIDEKKIKNARKDAKGVITSSKNVSYLTSYDIQKDSYDSGRNSKAFKDGAIPVAVYGYLTNDLLYIFSSVGEAGKHSTSPNSHGGRVSDSMNLKREYYYMMINGVKTKVYARDARLVKEDVRKIVVENTYRDFYKSTNTLF